MSVQKVNLSVYNYLQDNPCVDIANKGYAKAVMFVLWSCTEMDYAEIMSRAEKMSSFRFRSKENISALTHHLRTAERIFQQYIEPAFIEKNQQKKKRR